MGQALIRMVANIMGTDQVPVLAVQIHLSAYKRSVYVICICYTFLQYTAAMQLY